MILYLFLSLACGETLVAIATMCALALGAIAARLHYVRVMGETLSGPERAMLAAGFAAVLAVGSAAKGLL